jgi:hypothetical protein
MDREAMLDLLRRRLAAKLGLAGPPAAVSPYGFQGMLGRAAVPSFAAGRPGMLSRPAPKPMPAPLPGPEPLPAPLPEPTPEPIDPGYTVNS